MFVRKFVFYAGILCLWLELGLGMSCGTLSVFRGTLLVWYVFGMLVYV